MLLWCTCVSTYSKTLVEQELLTLPEYMSSPPVFSGVRVTRSVVLCACFVDRCSSLCTFSFGHCVVCSSSIYGFWLPLWYFQTLFIHWLPWIRLFCWKNILISINCVMAKRKQKDEMTKMAKLICESLHRKQNIEQNNSRCFGRVGSSCSTSATVVILLIVIFFNILNFDCNNVDISVNKISWWRFLNRMVYFLLCFVFLLAIALYVLLRITASNNVSSIFFYL